MRLLHYLELQNFKRFGDRQRIELDHPAVLIGPNNCGKTTAIQALALWSQAVKTWYQAKGTSTPKQRTATALNRLSIVSVPVQRTRYFWHNAAVRTGNRDIPLLITVGVLHGHRVEPITMRFRNQGDELVYCTPDDASLSRPHVIEAAADLDVALLYPMSGLDTEEPVLQPGRIDVLLGQGQTAQVLRNLCLMVLQNGPQDWHDIAGWIRRLFAIELDEPKETSRGSIELSYRQTKVREALDISLAGRGLQQMLLIFAYLYSHRRSVLLIDEPDAHLEILRQKQVYVLLRELAAEQESQVVLVTHSEVILEEAVEVEHNLALLLGGAVDHLAGRQEIRNALKYFGTDHYLRARQRGYVLYVEGSTDLVMLRALAERLAHPVAQLWDQRINAFYLRNTFPDRILDAELERVEGGFGLDPRRHFFALREMLPGLRGLAIFDNDGKQPVDSSDGGLRIVHWTRYEAENYFVTPELLQQEVTERYGGLFTGIADEVLRTLLLERVFGDREEDLETWKRMDPAGARLLWEARTERIKLSDLAEEFFRRLGPRLGHPMLLRKGELHQLVRLVSPSSVAPEVNEKLDLLQTLFENAAPAEEA